MKIFNVTKILKDEIKKLILENIDISDSYVYDDDFTNKSDVQTNNTIIFYTNRLLKSNDGFINYISENKSIYNLTFEVTVTLQTKDENMSLGDLLLYISNDRIIRQRFSNSKNKLEKNIKNITQLQNSNFIENDEKWFKQILTFNFIYEGEYSHGNI